MTNLDSKGFTLMEVMMAMAIFAIGILGVAKLQITSTGENTTSRTMTEGATVAVDDMEKLINWDYDDINATEITAATTVFPPVVTGASGVHYTVTRTINPYIKDVKQINVTTEWSDKGKKQTFTGNTYKTKAAD